MEPTWKAEREAAEVAEAKARETAGKAARTRAEKKAAKPDEPAKIRNFSWDAVKLASLSNDDLNTLRQQVYEKHANPRNERGAYTENGAESIYLYDREGRRKLDALAWASTYQIQATRAAKEEAARKIADLCDQCMGVEIDRTGRGRIHRRSIESRP